MATISLAIPCFNEAARLPRDAVRQLVRDSDLHLVLVDDGSSDGTAAVLEALRAEAPDRIDVVVMPRNRGKAEAVRQGLRSALDRADVVGYADADFSTPADELLRLAAAIRASGADAVIGSRVAHLGAHIERNPVRHYLGRVFATGASTVLGRPIYDTQCGAKFIRVSDALRAALTHPFRSRWAFDVELLGRLWAAEPGLVIVEEPLRRWVDVRGSKVRPTAMIRAGLELVLIAGDLRRARRSALEGDRADHRSAIDTTSSSQAEQTRSTE
jgi:glycosyltransferase involved in cell wall biosynthesis